VGETLNGEPVNAKFPPQLAVYHFQSAPKPKKPPDGLNKVEPPIQIAEEPFIDAAGTEVSLTLTVVKTQGVVLQVPSALTK